MPKKKKEKKSKFHVEFTKKVFLVPDSINSMSAVHTKIMKDGIGIIRISDCHNSIRLWNDLNNPKEVREMLQKIDCLTLTLKSFREQVKIKDPTII